MFGEWPAAAKWIAICTTVLALLGAGTAAYYGWKAEIRQKAQLEMLTKALAKQAENNHQRRITQQDVEGLDVERLIQCNAARAGTPAFDCCFKERKCPPLDGAR